MLGLPVSGSLGGVEYEWDSAKAALNRRKHGVDFADAIPALEDPNRIEQTSSPHRAAANCAESSRRGEQHVMSKTGIIRVTRKSGDPPPRGESDWTRLESMTDAEIEAAAGADPDAPPTSPERLATMHRVSRVKVLRQRLGMTQAAFAEAFHLPINTLRDWEQHRSRPDAPARALLLAIERDPEAMRRLLAPAAE